MSATWFRTTAARQSGVGDTRAVQETILGDLLPVAEFAMKYG